MSKQEYLVLGIMSGTSLDGTDIALLHFTFQVSWRYEILRAETIPYSGEWQGRFTEAVSVGDDSLDKLNEDYTSYLAEVIADFIRRNEISKLDAVCSHGHTVKHEPEKGYTLQIGNLPKLARLIDETVICDFRAQDVELGGQGAPLVPIGDELLFSDYEYCLNLGGFANISTRLKNERIAFDICAVNTVLNSLSAELGHPYDHNGDLAASGKLDETLLKELNSLGFYKERAPKSLGIEWVARNVFPLLKGKKDILSVLHTYTIHASIQISSVLDQESSSKVLVTGGGSFNGFLMDQIQKRSRNKIVVPPAELVNFKEALIFGFLGVLKLRGEINVLRSVTGALRDHSTGKVFGVERNGGKKQ